MTIHSFKNSGASASASVDRDGFTPTPKFGVSLQSKRGFTLIEVAVYLGLFAIIMGGVFVVTYQLIEGNERTHSRVLVQEEGNFIQRKLDWALTGATQIIAPTSTGAVLTIEKDSSTITFSESGGVLEMAEGAGAPVPLTTDWLTVSGVNFEQVPPSGAEPPAVQATFVIADRTFEFTKYLRK